jgi:hypothetical protein
MWRKQRNTVAFAGGCGILLAAGMLIGAVQGQVAPGGRTREPAAEEGGTARREGGIPRKAVEEGRARGGQTEGSEEGLPEARAQPRIKELSPRWIPPRGEWKLGVWGYNTDSGVVITRVAPGGAAQSQGMEAGDRIVTVGGYQVGYVGDLLYPLGYELQRQAGPRGEVRLLVQNVRGKELVNLDVRLGGGGRVRPLPLERQ